MNQAMTTQMETSNGMSPLGPGQQFQIAYDVERLVKMADVYTTLYGTELGKKVANEVAVNTFGVIQQALKEALVMGVARLIVDPAKSGEWENLSLARLVLVGEAPEANDTPLAKRLEELQKKYGYLRPIRNKIYGHSDVDTHREYGKRILRQDDTDKAYAFVEKTDLDVLDSVNDIVDFFSAWWSDQFPGGDPFEPDGVQDVDELMRRCS